MPIAIQPSQALEALNEALQKRDDELDSLRKQLEQLRRELKLTSAERDHLRTQHDSKERRDSVLRRSSSDNSTKNYAVNPDFSILPGQSIAKPISDPRVGRPKRLLVIGGGPAGLISLHELLNPWNRPKDGLLEDYTIHLYERRAEVGGVWYFEPENDIAKGWHHGAQGLRVQEEGQLKEHVHKPDSMQHAGDMELMDPGWTVMKDDYTPQPPTNGHADCPMANTKRAEPVNGVKPSSPDGSVASHSDTAVDFCYFNEPQTAPRWPSAAYEGLVGNVLPPLLEFSVHRFPKPKGGLFPSMTETHEYLLQLAEPLRPYIKTCQEILNVRPLFRDGSKSASWEVTKVDWTKKGHGVRTSEEWDGVIIAAGAFDHPYYPSDISGLQPLLDKQCPLIMHAKSYPGPRPFVNQHNKIVVVGNANSANDIAAHLAPLNSSGPIYRCIRHPSNFAHLPDSRIKDVPSIVSVKQSLDRATLSIILEDGMQIDGVTKLIFASGYEYRFPWVQVPTLEDQSKLCQASKHGAVPYLHDATFQAFAPSLAFVGLTVNSTPMPFAEIQARTVARTFYGLHKLPVSQDELLEDYNERAKELGMTENTPAAWRQLHMMRGAPERALTKKLLDALEADEEGASQGLFRWDEWREGVAKTMRATKERELRRLRDDKVASGGVDGGIGGVLSYGLKLGQKFNPVFGKRSEGHGKSLML